MFPERHPVPLNNSKSHFDNDGKSNKENKKGAAGNSCY